MENVGNDNIANYQEIKETRLSEVVALKVAFIIYVRNNLSVPFKTKGRILKMDHSTVIHHYKKDDRLHSYPYLVLFKQLFKEEVESLLKTEHETRVIIDSKTIRSAIEAG